MRRALRWLALAAALLFVLHAANLAVLHGRHFAEHGYFAPLGLHADLKVEGNHDAPHHALVIANFGPLPRRVRVCHSLTDTADPVSFFEFIVEERSAEDGKWKPLPRVFPTLERRNNESAGQEDPGRRDEHEAVRLSEG